MLVWKTISIYLFYGGLCCEPSIRCQRHNWRVACNLMILCSCFYSFIKDEKLAFTLNRNPLPSLNIVYVAASTSWNFSRIVAHSTRFSGGIKVALYTLICCYQVNYSCRYQERRQWVPSIYGSRYSRMDQKAVFHKFYVACSWIPWPI